MPAYPLRALVLRKTKLGETDVILTLLADDGRQVRAVAKGLRKPTSRFGGRLEPYVVVDLLLHTGRTLEVVTEARTVRSNVEVRTALERSAAAAVVADVLDKISLEGQPEERLFGLGTTTLEALGGTSDEKVPQVVVAFMLKALAMHGYRPELEECAVCAAEAGESEAFSLASGGVVCEKCGGLDPATLRFGTAGREWLRCLLMSTMSEIADAEIPAQAVADCFALVRSFVAYHLPTRLRALDFYAGMLETSTND